MARRRVHVNADKGGSLIIVCNGTVYEHRCEDDPVEEPLPDPELPDVVNYVMLGNRPPADHELEAALDEVKDGNELVVFVDSEVYGDALARVLKRAESRGVFLRVQPLRKGRRSD
jgi:hypothetical protein